MSVRYSEKHRDDIVPDVDKEVTIQLARRGGRQVIVIKEELSSDHDQMDTTPRKIEISVALLPELKRAVAALEKNSADGKAEETGEIRRPASFAHSSEEELARILDFYHIAWQYEPRTFAIEWNAEGNVVSSFTPDFYLPEHDLYIELTTLKQSLVTKKNRKVRLLRELYPEVNVRIFYASDYRKLIEKFAASGTWHDLAAEEDEHKGSWEPGASGENAGTQQPRQHKVTK